MPMIKQKVPVRCCEMSIDVEMLDPREKAFDYNYTAQ